MTAGLASPRPVRVVKVGGSLFDFDGLTPALRYWLLQQPPAVNVLLAGGGPWAEAVREADRRFHLGDEASHWLCIDALALTARLLANLLPEATFYQDFLALRDEVACRVCAVVPVPPIVFSPATFVRNDAEHHPQSLPRDWSVTSDSIAARLAEQLRAEELVLLKSTDAHSASGLVDDYFPIAARDLPAVRIVNLRSSFPAA